MGEAKARKLIVRSLTAATIKPSNQHCFALHTCALSGCDNENNLLRTPLVTIFFRSAFDHGPVDGRALPYVCVMRSSGDCWACGNVQRRAQRLSVPGNGE